MMRVYEIKVEQGHRWRYENYVVVAGTDESAVKKAKLQARRQYGWDTSWRCIELRERETEFVT